MPHQTFKEFYARTGEQLDLSAEARVRAIRRELQRNRRLTEGERLIVELQLLTFELLRRQHDASRR